MTGKNPLLDIALELEKIAPQTTTFFVERKLYPNVDFYSGLIYEALGLPVDMFPVMFAIPRTSGWLAQWHEMLEDPEQKIARPRQIYTGERTREYVPVERPCRASHRRRRAARRHPRSSVSAGRPMTGVAVAAPSDPSSSTWRRARRGEIARPSTARGRSLTHARPSRAPRRSPPRLCPARLGRGDLRRRRAEPVPARKATALVRRRRPAAPFVVAVARPSAPATSPRRSGASGPTRSSRPTPAAARGARADAHDAAPSAARRDEAHRLLLAQQAVADHVAAGLEPDDLSATRARDARRGARLDLRRRLAGGGRGAHAALHRDVARPGAGPQVAAFAEVSRGAEGRPGPGLPGRAWTFRRPAWIADVGADANMRRTGQAVRAGLTAAVAFPITLADDCAGVIEFFAAHIAEPDAQITAMFATVGGQLAQYFERAPAAGRREPPRRGRCCAPSATARSATSTSPAR